MKTTIPSAAFVRERLRDYAPPQLLELAEKSGVSFHTLLKIKRGDTQNPGIDTVRKFFGHVRG